MQRLVSQGLKPPTRDPRTRRSHSRRVRSAARLCRSVRASFSDGSPTQKADRSPVTVADLAPRSSSASRSRRRSRPIRSWARRTPRQVRGRPGHRRAALAAQLARLRPGIDAPTHGRGARARCADAGGPTGRWWTLDPVDGTKGFLRDEQYAVALALIEDGRGTCWACWAAPTCRAGRRSARAACSSPSGTAAAWELPLDARRAHRPRSVSRPSPT